ncbi:WxL domain-containing protein [Companilactobacillus zhachilii]|uniref:WxL domain-containing protein n=1 Tax=Companilactobacillus zhachilii TaxID=2304606 RepID=UPI0019251506|nr:WxL domain-containing protein [Companilactobacillus zhachilii]MBL3530465.1 WxL domain-containing protein [Companilactobacillus zhachilii]
MKQILKNSLLVGAAFLGLGSLGLGGYVAKAATTPTSSTTPATASATLTPGTITIKSAPSISFGTVDSSADDTSYASTAFSNSLQVANPGEPTGWTVSLSDTPFTDGTTGGATLKGASLSLDDSDATPVKADDADNVSTAPKFTSSATISSAPVTILDAAAGEGVGSFTTSYNGGDATLKVPAGNIGGSYTSQLSWTLTNAPS